jgi:hypothetical protein
MLEQDKVMTDEGNIMAIGCSLVNQITAQEASDLSNKSSWVHFALNEIFDAIRCAAKQGYKKIKYTHEKLKFAEFWEKRYEESDLILNKLRDLGFKVFIVDCYKYQNNKFLEITW